MSDKCKCEFCTDISPMLKWAKENIPEPYYTTIVNLYDQAAVDSTDARCAEIKIDKLQKKIDQCMDVIKSIAAGYNEDGDCCECGRQQQAYHFIQSHREDL